ncbi:hypothetical protein [Nonomuraea dietziae]|uniref:hypothetical protein n=1 Tax=Nonomuraea dietziae TaxID=65515 RepID=UPI0031E298F3
MTAVTIQCCAPIAREPLSETDAADLAVMLKAVADPVRLRPAVDDRLTRGRRGPASRDRSPTPST